MSTKGKQKFNVGDTVRILDAGNKAGWVKEMDELIGYVGDISDYDPVDKLYQVSFDKDSSWWYSEDSLSLVHSNVNVCNDQQLLTIQQAITLLKSNGYKIYKEY